MFLVTLVAYVGLLELGKHNKLQKFMTFNVLISNKSKAEIIVAKVDDIQCIIFQ